MLHLGGTLLHSSRQYMHVMYVRRILDRWLTEAAASIGELLTPLAGSYTNGPVKASTSPASAGTAPVRKAAPQPTTAAASTNPIPPVSTPLAQVSVKLQAQALLVLEQAAKRCSAHTASKGKDSGKAGTELLQARTRLALFKACVAPGYGSDASGSELRGLTGTPDVQQGLLRAAGDFAAVKAYLPANKMYLAKELRALPKDVTYDDLASLVLLQVRCMAYASIAQ